MRRRCARSLHFSRLSLLQKLCLLQVLVFHLRLRVRIGILLSRVGVITLLHLSQLLTLLLLSCLQLGLLTLVVRRLIRRRSRGSGSRLGFGQLPSVYGDGPACAARTHDVRVEGAGPRSRGNLRLAVIH